MNFRTVTRTHERSTYLSIMTAMFLAGSISTATAQEAEAPIAQTFGLPYGANVSLACADFVVDAAISYAEENNWAVVVAVGDSAGQLVSMGRMDNAHRASTAFALEKISSAALTKRSTKVFADALANGRLAMLGFSDLHVHVAEGGEVLVLNETIVGSVGVAGVTQTQDREIALAGIRALANCS
jgi:uncharacterized protein GlcG (DUF336 family)